MREGVQVVYSGWEAGCGRACRLYAVGGRLGIRLPVIHICACKAVAAVLLSSARRWPRAEFLGRGQRQEILPAYT